MISAAVPSRSRNSYRDSSNEFLNWWRDFFERCLQWFRAPIWISWAVGLLVFQLFLQRLFQEQIWVFCQDFIECFRIESVKDNHGNSTRILQLATRSPRRIVCVNIRIFVGILVITIYVPEVPVWSPGGLVESLVPTGFVNSRVFQGISWWFLRLRKL